MKRINQRLFLVLSGFFIAVLTGHGQTTKTGERKMGYEAFKELRESFP